MTWQGAGGTGDDRAGGTGADPGGAPVDDETRADWGNPGADATPPPPYPDGPPPVPAGAPMAQPPALPPAPPAAPPPPGWGPAPVAPGGAPVGWAPPVESSLYGVPGAPGLVFAGAWPRFVAYLVDIVLIALVTSPIGFILLGSIETTAASMAGTVVTVGLEFIYFVGFWTSGGRATIGMRIVKLQVGNAYDGRVLDINQAIRRWVGLGAPLGLIGIVPALANAANGLSLLWWIALLLSTVVSPTKQGLHDRFANSVVVQPLNAGSGGLVLGCLIIAAAFILLPIIALVMLGPQIADILSAVGQSV